MAKKINGISYLRVNSNVWRNALTGQIFSNSAIDILQRFPNGYPTSLLPQPSTEESFRIFLKGEQFARPGRADVLLDTGDQQLNEYYTQRLVEEGAEFITWIYESDAWPTVSVEDRAYSRDPITNRASVNIPKLIEILENRYGLQPNHPTKVYVALDFEEDWLAALSEGRDPLASTNLDPLNDADFLGDNNRRATQAYTDITTACQSYFGPNVKFSNYGIPRIYNFVGNLVAPIWVTNPIGNPPETSVEWRNASPESREIRIQRSIQQNTDVMQCFDWYMGTHYDAVPSKSSLVENGGVVNQRANSTPFGQTITDFDFESLQDDQRSSASYDATYRIIGENSTKPVFVLVSDMYPPGIHYRTNTDGGPLDGPKGFQYIPIPEIISRLQYIKTQNPKLNGMIFWNYGSFVHSGIAFTSEVSPANNTETYWFRTSIVRELYGGAGLGSPEDPVFNGTFSAWNDPALKNDVGIRYNNRILKLVKEIKRVFRPDPVTQFSIEGNEIWASSWIPTDPGATGFGFGLIAQTAGLEGGATVGNIPESMGNVNRFRFVKPMVYFMKCAGDGGFEWDYPPLGSSGATGFIEANCFGAYNSNNGRLRAIKDRLLELPKGKRTISPRRYDQGNFFASSYAIGATYWDSYPNGVTASIFADSIGATLANDFKLVLEKLKDLGADIDYIPFDMEEVGIKAQYDSNSANALFDSRVNAIISDDRYNQSYYGGQPFSEILGEFSGFTLNDILNGVAHPQLNPSYLYWDRAITSNFASWSNEFFVKTAQSVLPQVNISNYNGYLAGATNDNYFYDGNLHTARFKSVIGNAQAPVMYGGIGPTLAYGVLISDSTKIFRTNVPGFTTYAGGFPNTAWNNFLIIVQNIRSVKRETPNIPLRPWIASIDWKETSFPTAPWKESASNTGLYYEMVRHLCLSGTEMFNYWNPNDWRDDTNPYSSPNRLTTNLINLNKTIADVTTRLGGYSNTIGNFNKIDFLTNYIISGSKIVNTNKYLWRFTPKPGEGLFQNDETNTLIILDSDGGAWIETETSEMPSVSSANLWTPDQIGPSLLAWYDAEETSSFTIDGGVSVWNDISGNNLGLTQANSNNRPQKTQDGNTFAYVQFDGVDDCLRSSPTEYPWPTPLQQPFTVIVVFSPPEYADLVNAERVWSGFQRTYSVSDDSWVFGYIQYASAGVQANYAAYSGNPFGSASIYKAGGNPDYSPNIIMSAVTFNGIGNSVNRMHGITFSPATTTNSNSLYGLCLGADSNGGSVSLNSEVGIYEFMIVTGNVDASDIEKIEGYLAHKRNTKNLLPINHPYKLAPPTV
jgi:hypothetical protein